MTQRQQLLQIDHRLDVRESPEQVCIGVRVAVSQVNHIVIMRQHKVKLNVY